MKLLPVPMTGGVNLFADPTKVRDDELVLAKNVAPVQPGVIGQRGAMQGVRNLGDGTGLTVPTRAMFSPIGKEFALAHFLPSTSKTYFNLVDDGHNFVSDPGLELEGTSGVPVPVCMVQWDGDTYAFAGYNSGVRAAFASTPEGYVLENITFAGSGNEGFRPKGAAAIRDRFVYWGFDDGAGGRSVLFADRGLPLQIGDNAVAAGRYIPVAGIAQTGITHCAEINTQGTGSPNQSVVAVWTTDNMWMLLGEPGETGDGSTVQAIIGSLQQNLLPMNAGCVAGATVQQTPYGTIWAGPDDVWFMPFGSLPIRIGTKIRPALLNSPPSMKWRWHAMYDADKAQYRLAIFGDSAGPVDDSACDSHWILDLSQGPPRNADEAKWWGPQVYVQPVRENYEKWRGTHCLVSRTGDGGDFQMYGLVAYWVQLFALNNSTDGVGVGLVALDVDDTRDNALIERWRYPAQPLQAYELGDEVVPMDEFEGYTLPLIWTVTTAGTTGALPRPVFNGNGTGSMSITWGTVTFQVSAIDVAMFHPRRMQDGNEIIPDLVTKEYHLDPMQDKLIDGAELSYWVSGTGTASYRLLTDIDETERVLPGSGDELGVVGFPTGSPAPAYEGPPAFRGQRIWKARILPATPGSRSVAKSVQLRLTTTNEFTIDSTNDTLTFRFNSIDYARTITRGQYTYSALLEAIEGALGPIAGIVINPTAGSTQGITNIDTKPIIFQFARLSGADVRTAAQFAACARLMSLLGVDTNQGEYSAGVSTLTIVAGGTEQAWQSQETTRTFQLQIGGLNLRVRPFRRRPM